MFAARATPLGGHGAHLALLAVWVAVVAGVLLIDHLRGNRWRNIDSDQVNSPSPVTDPESPTSPPRVSMATWPPREFTSASRARRRTSSHGSGRVWRIAAMIGSLIAAAVHLVVMPEHFEESYWYGAFFATTAAMQVGYAALIAVRLRPTLLRAGIAGNGAVVLLWAYTRLIEVPLGPGRGETESIGLLDIIATSAEVATVIACVVALLQHRTVAWPSEERRDELLPDPLAVPR